MKDAIVEYIRRRVMQRQFHVSSHAKDRAHERGIGMKLIWEAAETHGFSCRKSEIGLRDDIKITVSCPLGSDEVVLVFGVSRDLTMIDLITLWRGGERS